MEIATLIITSIILIIIVLGLVVSSLVPGSALNRIKENLKNRWNQSKFSDLERENFIINLADVLIRLSSKKIGALIIYEQRNSLNIYEESGFKMDSAFDVEFVYAIFSNKQASFHDGALIVSNNNIKAISCFVPITKEANYSKHGARHRAALGISEITDSISFVVSETNGNISFAKKGDLSILGKKKEEIIESLKRLI